MVHLNKHGVLTHITFCFVFFSFFSPLLCSYNFSLFSSFFYSFSAAGHVFNMPHDNVKACEEVFGKLEDNHMMSPTLIRINRTSPWSPCSAAIITDYLDSGHGKSKKVILYVSCWPRLNLQIFQGSESGAHEF